MKLEEQLELIIGLRVGETINLTTEPPTASLHDTWGTSTYRWWYSENGEKLYNWVNDVISTCLLSMSIILHQEDRYKLTRVASGLRNLAMTYRHHLIRDKFNNLIKRVDFRIYGFKS